MFDYILDWFRPRFGSRHSSWRKIRGIFLQKFPVCEVCESKKGLEVHHIKMYSTHPELELEMTNLITLCRRCHLLFGHLDNWRKINDEVLEDAKIWNYKLKNKI